MVSQTGPLAFRPADCLLRQEGAEGAAVSRAFLSCHFVRANRSVHHLHVATRELIVTEIMA